MVREIPNRSWAHHGIFIEFPHHHSTTVPLNLNSPVWHISPKYYVIFDNAFSTMISCLLRMNHLSLCTSHWECYFDTSDFESESESLDDQLLSLFDIQQCLQQWQWTLMQCTPVLSKMDGTALLQISEGVSHHGQPSLPPGLLSVFECVDPILVPHEWVHAPFVFTSVRLFQHLCLFMKVFLCSQHLPFYLCCHINHDLLDTLLVTVVMTGRVDWPFIINASISNIWLVSPSFSLYSSTLYQLHLPRSNTLLM